MGLLDWLFGLMGRLGLYTKNRRIAFLGLDNAGKTTLLRLLESGELGVHVPTQHPTSEELRVGGVHFTAFDLGGHAQARGVWRDYFDVVDAIVFLIDVADHERAEEARTELWGLLATESLAGVPLLVLGNKTDIEGALSEARVRVYFELGAAAETAAAAAAAAAGEAETSPVHLQMCSLTRREGYEEGFRWLAGVL